MEPGAVVLDAGEPSAARRPRSLRRVDSRWLNAVRVTITVVVFAVLRASGLVAQTPLWVYVALVVGSGVLGETVFGRSDPDCSTRRLHSHAAFNIGATTAVIYASGWGPMLALGYVYVASDLIRRSGARAALPCLIWSLVGVGGGQVAIAAHATPSFLGSPEVHGLGALAALGVSFLIHSSGMTTGKKEQAEAEVRRSERRFRSLVQTGTDVVAVVDAELRVLYVSPSVERTGFDPELFGLDLAGVHPDDQPSLSGALAEVIEEAGRVVQAELRLRHADSGWRWVDVSLTNCIDDPTIRGTVVNLHDISERKQFEERLAYAAFHDRLTGVLNRAGFSQRLDDAGVRARAEHLTTALLFVDIDRFKVINDSFGHNIGDRVLVEIAARLRGCVRAGDTIGRFGGDEFILLVEDVTPAAAATIAAKVTAALRWSFDLNGGELPVSASVGLAVTDELGDPADLLRSADMAMYLAKENGRARWEQFDPSLGSGMYERYVLVADLRHAIEHDEFVTEYQPEISLETGAVVGFEALVRWLHPARGRLLPGSFIAAAEENDLILAIDRGVLAAACRQLQALEAVRGTSSEPLTMSVNMSPGSLTTEGANELLRIVAASGVDPTHLRLEITERVAVDGSSMCLAALERLRQQHIRVVIDDFGTGYSSLECLQRLPVDGLKIDRGFVGDLDVTPSATAIVKAIISLGHELGLPLTAEGVETKAQRDRLRSLGCDTAQGFYISESLTAEDAAWFLRSEGLVSRSR